MSDYDSDASLPPESLKTREFLMSICGDYKVYDYWDYGELHDYKLPNGKYIYHIINWYTEEDIISLYPLFKTNHNSINTQNLHNRNFKPVVLFVLKKIKNHNLFK